MRWRTFGHAIDRQTTNSLDRVPSLDHAGCGRDAVKPTCTICVMGWWFRRCARSFPLDEMVLRSAKIKPFASSARAKPATTTSGAITRCPASSRRLDLGESSVMTGCVRNLSPTA
jgi:hypothetical protein